MIIKGNLPPCPTPLPPSHPLPGLPPTHPASLQPYLQPLSSSQLMPAFPTTSPPSLPTPTMVPGSDSRQVFAPAVPSIQLLSSP